MQIKLAGDFNTSAYKDAFSQHGHVQIKPVLEEETAHQLHKVLRDQLAWNTVFNEDQVNCEMSAEDIRSVGPQMAQQIVMDVHKRARNQFQFLYQRYSLADKARNNRESNSSLKALFDFLNGDIFLSAMREVTGFSAIQFSDPNPTLYKPGHFLTDHDDDKYGQGRLVAFVLNLTPEWRPEWGGNLLFHDGDGRITGGYVPIFNALNIFKVPRAHFVSYVAPFGMERYSITGWLRTNAG